MTARERIVELLVEHKLPALVSDMDFARHILRHGFAGFEHFSTSQLQCMVCDTGLDLHDGMGLLLHDLMQEEPLVPSIGPLDASHPPAGAPTPVVTGVGTPTSLPGMPDMRDPRTALAQEIRHYFQYEASSPVLVQVMLDNLGAQAASINAQDNFQGLDALSVVQLRRLVPVSLAQRERVRSLLAQLEHDIGTLPADPI